MIAVAVSKSRGGGGMPIVITPLSSSVAVNIKMKGHSKFCACDKTDWECSPLEGTAYPRRRRGKKAVEGRTEMSAVGRFTLTPQAVVGSSIRRRRNKDDSDGGGTGVEKEEKLSAHCRRRATGGGLDLPRGLMCPYDDRRRRGKYTSTDNTELITTNGHPGCHDEAFPIENIKAPTNKGSLPQYDLAICYAKESQVVDELKVYSRDTAPQDWERADKYMGKAVRRRNPISKPPSWDHHIRRRTQWYDVREMWLMSEFGRRFVDGVPYCEGWCCAHTEEECTADPESCPKCRMGARNYDPINRRRAGGYLEHPYDMRETEEGLANPYFCIPQICGLRKMSFAQEKTCCEQFHCIDGPGGDCYEYVSKEYPVGSWSDEESSVHGRTSHWVNDASFSSFGTWCNSWERNSKIVPVNGSFNGGRGHCPDGAGPRVRMSSCSSAAGDLKDCSCAEGECMCLGSIHGESGGNSTGPTEPEPTSLLEEQARAKDSPNASATTAPLLETTTTPAPTPVVSEDTPDMCDIVYTFSPSP